MMSSQRRSKVKQVSSISSSDSREKYFEYFAICILVAIAIYQGYVLFGHKTVPISDFPAFAKTGREILAFKCPSDFKRGPVTGILQVLFGKIAGGRYPDLRGGWLLNTVLHPLNVILLWLIARKLIGKAAIWFTAVVMINPWTVYMVIEPLAETPLLFFLLLTVYLISINSSWAYLTASITTMVRYEGAALILAAFLMDIIYKKTTRERILAFVYSALASVPLILWLIGTFLHREVMEAGEHYLTVFSKKYAQFFIDKGQGRTGFVKHLGIMWNVAFKPLLTIDPQADPQSVQALWFVGKFVVLTTFVFGAIWGSIKRNRLIFVLLIFLVPYFLLHAYYPYPISRYHSTIFWIVLLICIFGAKQLWSLAKNRLQIPSFVARISEIVIFFVALFLMTPLFAYTKSLGQICSPVASFPYIMITSIILISLFACALDRFKNILSIAAVAAVMIFVVLSNQFSLAYILNDGKQDIEFKYLADWYAENAKPGEKMAVYMCETVAIFVPDAADCFIQFPYADTPQQLVEKLKQLGVTYVCWASREGFSRDPYGDRRLNLHVTIPFLVSPQDNGPYKFITQIRYGNRFINVFRL